MDDLDRAKIDVKSKLQRESVWDYPRPPRMESTQRHLRVVHAGIGVAETIRGRRILETSHPPVYYFPPEDVAIHLLRPASRKGSYCEFKGVASYWDLVIPKGSLTNNPGEDNPASHADVLVRDIAWSYATPSASYAALKNHFAFYANRVDECWVDDEQVIPQPGDFYGGWITSHIQGPFKGGPGTMGW